MKNNKNIFYKLIKNGGLFLILIGITFYFIFKEISVERLVNTISRINVLFLIPAIACMFIFILCEGINTKRNLKALGYKTTIFKCFTYSVNGFFFSSITPSASGGQPMQVYHMCKDNIKLSHSTLVLFIELVFFQIVTIIYSLIGYLANYSLLSSSIGSIKYLLIIGLIINISVVIVLLLTIFSYTTVSKIINIVANLLNKCGCTKTEIIREKAYSIIDEYKNCSSYVIKNKLVVLKTFLTTCLQIFAFHSIPFWVYCSFGLSEYSILVFIGVQAVLFIAVSAIPLPGAVGASESGFLMLFKLFFPIAILNEAMLISRGISFYLCLLLTGGFLLITWMIKSKVNNRNERLLVEFDA